MPPLRLNAGRHSLASKKNRRFRPPVEADGPSGRFKQPVG